MRVYQPPGAEAPLARWLTALRDNKAKATILARINRLRLGDFGDAKSVAGPVHELRIHIGPGYRLYYARARDELVLLLLGGTKSTQSRDIAKARAYWRDYCEGQS